jgi:hypothetical protein
MLLAGTLLATTSISGTLAINVTGAKSLNVSYATFSMLGLIASAPALVIAIV